jgi:hypothetical protein
LTQIAALPTSAINLTADGQTTLRLGRGEIPLPEPLAAIALALRNQRVNRGEGIAGCSPAATAEPTSLPRA